MLQKGFARNPYKPLWCSINCMIYSYREAREQPSLATHTRRFVQTAEHVNAPEGLVIGPEALAAYVDGLVGINDLLSSVSDAESVHRVDNELRRRFLTGRVPELMSQQLIEALELLGLDDDLKVTDLPLVAVLSTDEPLDKPAVIINVVGRKSLADAIRALYARLYTHPYPDSTPNASIILYRMPPLLGTARVEVAGERATVDAVHGWGLFVGAQEVADTYSLKSSGTLVGKEVREQDSMVYRNPRSGEVVQTRPRDASSQKLTDTEARTLVLLTKKAGLQEAVFGFSHDNRWFLNGSGSLEVTQQPEPVAAPPNEPEEEDASAEIVIVDMEEDEDSSEPEVVASTSLPASDAEPAQTSQPAPPNEVEPVDDSQPAPEPEVTQQPQPAPEIPSEPVSHEPEMESAQPEEVTSVTSATQAYEAAQLAAKEVLVAALDSIERTLREWVRGDQAEDFEALVQQVSSRRTVPYKNRVLTLFEMREQGSFESPSPEAVRFGLETLERFRKEF